MVSIACIYPHTVVQFVVAVVASFWIPDISHIGDAIFIIFARQSILDIPILDVQLWVILLVMEIILESTTYLIILLLLIIDPTCAGPIGSITWFHYHHWSLYHLYVLIIPLRHHPGVIDHYQLDSMPTIDLCQFVPPVLARHSVLVPGAATQCGASLCDTGEVDAQPQPLLSRSTVPLYRVKSRCCWYRRFPGDWLDDWLGGVFVSLVGCFVVRWVVAWLAGWLGGEIEST